LECIRICRQLLPEIPHIAVFDTAYHKTIPDYAFQYAIPSEWYKKRKFRRYGFHGTSVEYVVTRMKSFLGNLDNTRLIVLHLGNGASITAVRNGMSIDTSMGMTPLEGLVMGTRSGDIDPGVILAMQRTEELSVDQVDQILNKKSGLFGITNGLRDMRDVENSAQEGNQHARLALKITAYRIQKYIGAYFTILGGLDAIVFTGGIGEKSSHFRQIILDGLSALGVKIDSKLNNVAVHGKEEKISSTESQVQVFVIPTNEELMMALKASQKVIEKKKQE
jgi:acetate kinase